MESRFTRFIHFDDFNIAELCSIYAKSCDDNQYKMTQKCRAYLSLLFTLKHGQRDERFGNARFVRNVFEETVSRHSVRLVNLSENWDDKELLQTLDFQDVPIDLVLDTSVKTSAIDLTGALWRGECPSCSKAFKLGMDFLGRRLKCKTCDLSFPMPWCNLLTETVKGIPQPKSF
jgi:hypothetical protein